MIFVSVTRLRVRAWIFLPDFLLNSLRATRQARAAAGNLGVEVKRDARLTFWTKSAWQDEKSMRAFMLSGDHKKAMKHLARWCSEASVVHWEQEFTRLPFWEDASRRMQRDGRLSKVDHPSAAQQAGQIPPMKV